MVRPALNQPGGKVKKSYAPYISPSVAAAAANGTKPRADYGQDNFSFDKQHLITWTPPAALYDTLPPKLKKAVANWTYGGAALSTGLRRIQLLAQDTVDRADPQSTHPHLFPRRNSSSTQAADQVGSTSAEPGSPGSVSSSRSPLPVFAYSKVPMIHPYPQVGVDTPPFTPVDSKTTNTPAIPSLDKNGMAPDLRGLADRLSYQPLSPQSSLSTSFGSSGDSSKTIPNQMAWETYIRQYNAEVYDIRKHAWPRFKGYGQAIEKLLMEYKHFVKLSQEEEGAVAQFKKWWESEKPKVRHCDVLIDSLPDKRVEGWEDLMPLTANLMRC